MWAYCLADQVFILLIKTVRFENLQITDIIVLNLFTFTEKARMKFRIKMKKKHERKLNIF